MSRMQQYFGLDFLGIGFDPKNEFEYAHGNFDIAVAANAVRTATQFFGPFVNTNGKGCVVMIDVTAVTATGSITIDIQRQDVVSGKFFTILSSAAITTVSSVELRVYPGIAVVANASASDVLSRNFRILSTHANAVDMTYSIGASIIL